MELATVLLLAVVAQPAPDFHAPQPALRAYVETALAENPALQQAHARSRAARERAAQVRALPDPVLSVTQALRSVETRVGPQRNVIALSQTFPWFGTLGARERVALLEATALEHRWQAARREVIAGVKDAYYELGFLDVTLGLSHEEQSLLEHYETLAQARYATGQGLQQEVIRLQAEISGVLDRRHRMDRQRGMVAARLNALLNRPPGQPVPPVPAFDRPEVAIDHQRLQVLGQAHRKELQAVAALIESGRVEVELAHRDRKPDITASLGMVRVAGRDDALPDNGKDALTLTVGVSLPLWSERYDAGVEQANHQLRARTFEREAAESAMERDIEDATVRIETLERQLDLLETVLIPQTGEALHATESAYGTGQLGVLELLDGERALIEVRTMRARYLSDLLIGFSALERAIGTRVPLTGDLP